MSGGMGGGMGGNVVHAPVTFNAAQMSPSEVSNAFGRHTAEARNFRTHDLEPELT